MKWYLKVMRNYSQFNGRARRKEYWMFTLFNTLFYILAATIDGALGLVFGLSIIYYLVVLIPSLSVAVRRLHDVGKSGWFLLLGVVPSFIGGSLLIIFPANVGVATVAGGLMGIMSIIFGIWIFILFCSNSKPGENKYGPNPKES